MPNGDFPRGLVPVKHLANAPFNDAVRAFSTAAGDATALMIGDPVKLAGTSQSINGYIYPDVTRAATGDVLVGVVVGVQADTNTSTNYRAASTARIVLVNDDPHSLFEIQEVSGGTPLTANDIGLNANFVVAAGSTSTGLSGVELNNATEATTNTLDLHIVGFMNRPDNEIGEHAKWLVRINRHQYSNQVAGI